MPDLAHVWGNDLQLSPTGDLATVADTPAADAETQQRILHRLLTNVEDYIWQLDYGAGLGQFVGQGPQAPAVAGIIRQQMALEPTVAASPPPSVRAQVGPTGNLTITVQYADAQTGQSRVLAFPVGG